MICREAPANWKNEVWVIGEQTLPLRNLVPAACEGSP